MHNVSPAQLLASLPEAEQLRALETLDERTRAYLTRHWPFWARPNQLEPPGEWWTTWLVLAGRGFGKTRCGAEWIIQNVKGATPLSAGAYSRVALVAETAADARDVLVEGNSGILACSPRDFRPTYEPSKRRLTWPNGAVATLYNGTEPDQLRGPQHDLGWVDELAKFDYAQETWDMLQFGLRLGYRPKQIVTTTPRPIPIVKELVKDSLGDAPSVIVTRGSTYDNKDNLAESFVKTVIKKYEGTRLGRQELAADILDDLPGALWSLSTIDSSRVKWDQMPELTRIVIAIDPSGTKGKDKDPEREAGDDVGIIAAGMGIDGRGYVLGDGTCNLSPAGWGARAVSYYNGSWSKTPEIHKADVIVAERNFGGDMVRYVIQSIDSNAPYKDVVASRGKIARAEPVALLYEKGMISHVGTFPELEDQMCLFAPDGYVGEGSPDRADAAIWALTELFLAENGTYRMFTR